MLFIFDMGGVVTRDAGFERRLGKAARMSAEEFFATCAGGCSSGVCRADIMLRLSNGQITERQFWEEFTKRSGKEIKGEPWSLMFNPTRDAAVVSLIQRLSAKHRVVCGTNTIECHYMEHIERGDYALFDKVYASNRIGISKPDEAFWQTILDAEEVNAADAFFTDDREDNCEAAARLGIHVHRFAGAQGLEEAVKEYL